MNPVCLELGVYMYCAYVALQVTRVEHRWLALGFNVCGDIRCYSIPCKYENNNSLGHERPPGLDVKQSPNAQDVFWPTPGLISCTRVTRGVGITWDVRATQMAGLGSSLVHV